MTLRDMLTALRRRWWVCSAVIVVAVVVYVLALRTGGIYTTKTEIAFLMTSSTALSPNNGSTDESIIEFARSVAAQVNSGRSSVSYSMDSAPYYGAGLRQGVLVVVPNDGNQWYESYSHAEIDIQIVGRTKEWVERQQTKYVDEVLTTARAQQRLVGADPSAFIATSVVPLTLDIGELKPTSGQKLAAAGAMGLAGLIVGIGATVLVDRRLLRRASSRTRTPRRPPRIDQRDSRA